MPDVAIFRYQVCFCNADRWMVPGDCHGPNGPRNDSSGRALPISGCLPHNSNPTLYKNEMPARRAGILLQNLR